MSRLSSSSTPASEGSTTGTATGPITITGTTTGTRIVIGDGMLASLGAAMRDVGLTGRAFVITERRVAERYGEAVMAALDAVGFRPALVAIEGGEGAKSLAQAGELYAWLADQRTERRDAIVALGGGVIGDLAGFVAATYLRGVALVQVPTTVLAQVDSAIGGKTAVNLAQGKNLVGAFHPPRLTLIDVAVLATLPPRELHAGWAEVIKTAMIFDAPLFEQIEHTRPEALSSGDRRDIIARCVQWKQRLCDEDPTEKGPRMLLNFGHTIGHALESSFGYGTYLHGEAVAIGMVGAAEISRRLGLIDRRLVERLQASLEGNGLPVRYDARRVPPEAVLRAAAVDKKSRGARLQWILLTGLGQTTISGDVPEGLVLDVLHWLGTEEPAQHR
jgi:3-dehydroquinate synthase